MLTCACIGAITMRRLCGSSAHKSQALWHHMKQWLMIGDVYDIHHPLSVSFSMRSKCHYIKHLHMLAVVLCKSEGCTWTRQMCCGCSAHQSKGLPASDELGSAAESSSADDVSWACSLVLALYISKRCIRTWAHMLWFQWTSVTTSVASHAAVMNERSCFRLQKAQGLGFSPAVC